MGLNTMEIKKLLVYFIKNAPKELGRTELMKYVYLFEYYYFQMYGRQYSDLVFERYKFGPNQTEVVEATYELEREGIINILSYENYYGGISYNHRIENINTPEYDLDSTEVEVASFIVDVLGKENYRGVLNVAYDTPPMKEIIKEEKKDGDLKLGRVIDMSKSKPIFKSSRQKRRLARERLEAKQQARGSDEEYYSHLLDQYESFEDTRRRAIVADQ